MLHGQNTAVNYINQPFSRVKTDKKKNMHTNTYTFYNINKTLLKPSFLAFKIQLQLIALDENKVWQYIKNVNFKVLPRYQWQAKVSLK